MLLNAWSLICKEKALFGISLTKAQKKKIGKLVNSFRVRGLVRRDGRQSFFISEEAFQTALPDIQALKLRIGPRQKTVEYSLKNNICLL